ncbi:hypothetical protein L1887_62789 [Cichorium endivia]|nr:hypothetical protein L1887_62789 [Cichorium endivia]
MRAVAETMPDDERMRFGQHGEGHRLGIARQEAKFTATRRSPACDVRKSKLQGLGVASNTRAKQGDALEAGAQARKRVLTSGGREQHLAEHTCTLDRLDHITSHQRSALEDRDDVQQPDAVHHIGGADPGHGWQPRDRQVLPATARGQLFVDGDTGAAECRDGDDAAAVRQEYACDAQGAASVREGHL